MYFCASNYQVSVNQGESLILAWCEYNTVSVGLLKHTFCYRLNIFIKSDKIIFTQSLTCREQQGTFRFLRHWDAVGYFCMSIGTSSLEALCRAVTEAAWQLMKGFVSVTSAEMWAGGQGFTVFFLLFSPEKLSSAKEENLGMHQVLDQTLLELNSL